MSTIDDERGLRAIYRPASPGVMNKQIDHLDEGAADFLAATTLVVVASFGASGADASPRGGPPGFVTPLDRHRLAFGDLAGNNRLDTYGNLTDRADIGLLCIVPGIEETMRVNGTASISTDPAVLEKVAIDGRPAKVAVVVDVVECYIHCGKALRRAGLWTPDTWPEKQERPSPVAILVKHAEIPYDPEVVERDLDAAYDQTLWEHGGS